MLGMDILENTVVFSAGPYSSESQSQWQILVYQQHSVGCHAVGWGLTRQELQHSNKNMDCMGENWAAPSPRIPPDQCPGYRRPSWFLSLPEGCLNPLKIRSRQPGINSELPPSPNPPQEKSLVWVSPPRSSLSDLVMESPEFPCDRSTASGWHSDFKASLWTGCQVGSLELVMNELSLPAEKITITGPDTAPTHAPVPPLHQGRHT